jgi:hypothetical protein
MSSSEASTPDGASAPRGPRKALLVALTVLITGVAIEASARLIELAVDRWRASRPAPANPFLATRNVVPVFQRSKDGATWERTKHHWISKRERFLVEKPPGGVRVFCLGGSAAAGWPHDAEASYPGFLREMLARALPGRSVEVVNAAGHTYASYRVKVVFDEIVAYEPDFVVLYTGNNEFLESVVYTRAGSQEDDGPLAVLRLSRRMARALAGPPTIDIQNYSQRDHTINRLSFAFGRASELREDPEQFAAVSDHYRFNLEAMLAEGRRRGIPVLLTTVPVNVRDWRPNVSLHGTERGSEARDRWQSAFREGVLALEASRPRSAIAPLARAAAQDERYADTWFQLGRAHLAAGDPAAARGALVQALHRDAYPFRSVFDAVVREVADASKAPLLDLTSVFAGIARDGIPGFDLFVDYVHPAAAANERIAFEVVREAANRGWLPAELRVPPEELRIAVDPEVEERVPVLRGLFGQFLVMRRYEHLDGLAVRLRSAIAEELPRTTPERRERLRGVLGDVGRVMRVVRPYRRLLRAEQLGLLDDEFTPEEAEAVFDAYAAMIRALEARDMPISDFQRLASHARPKTAEP